MRFDFEVGVRDVVGRVAHVSVNDAGELGDVVVCVDVADSCGSWRG